MQKQWFSILLTLGICMPFFSYAADDSGYIGKALGLDFYSVIDDGSYSLINRSVRLELEKTKTLGELGVGCPGIEYIAELMSDEKILNYGTVDYANLSAALAQSEKLKGKVLTIDTYQGLVLCLQDRYTDIVERKGREIDRIQKISSIGLYTDGDTTNSDYDIISDIDRIDTILFSEALKYTGVKNTASSSMSQKLSLGITPPLLIPEKPGVTRDPGVGGGDGADPGKIGADTPPHISDILGELCTSNNTSIPIESIMDEGFLSELGRTLRGGGGVGTSGGSSKEPIDKQVWVGNGPDAALTGASDFFHPKGSCGGIFCIDVKIIGGTANLLGGSKTQSIESILEKHRKILEPIEATNLKCQKMTNQSGQSPSKSPFTLGGLNVIIASRGQPVKRFKSEVTPKTEAEELTKIAQCAYASAGLSTDLTLANGPSVAGGSLNSAATIGTIQKRTITTGPQSMDQGALSAYCFDIYMDQGRAIYYDSLMTDVSAIEVFTRSLVKSLTDIVLVGSNLDTKPVGCK